jgi:hypothetical protein
MNTMLSRIALMSAITFMGSNALAQANAGTPAAVGTTPQAAAEATQKAVPRSDTGTVVRTSPSAVDKARQVAPAASSSTSSASTTDATAPQTGARPARADRN